MKLRPGERINPAWPATGTRRYVNTEHDAMTLEKTK